MREQEKTQEREQTNRLNDNNGSMTAVSRVIHVFNNATQLLKQVKTFLTAVYFKCLLSDFM